MYDPWVTREITIRDLLVHRSGLGPGAGDLLFAPRSDLSREETVRRLRFIKPATSFRSTYTYDNLAYVVLGQLIEEVSGESWERYVHDSVLAPAGMEHATVDTLERLETANRAHPHARISGAFRGEGPQVELEEANGLGDNVGPAGGIAASAGDMASWLKLQLGQGQIAGGKRVYSQAQAAEMWKPVMTMPIGTPPPEMRELQPKFLTYALGWSVREYRGERVIMHSGAILGSLSAVVLVPDRNVGFYLAINSEDEPMVRGLVYELLDHYLGLPKDSWPEKLKAQNDSQIKQLLPIVKAASVPPAKSAPSLALQSYAGAFSDPWFGTIQIVEKGGELSIAWPHSPGLTSQLEHWQHDSFKATFNDPSVDPIFVTFSVGPDGKVSAVRMKPFSPLGGYDYEDLRFEPVKEK